jgi:cadmium resistance protein CadD (predicted permease)
MAEVRLEHGSTTGSAADGVASWIETLARVGYASRGVLYIIIGALAIALAMGNGGATTGSRGALQTIAEQPLGTAALIVIALGLAGYAAWRISQAFANPERLGSDAKGVLRRVGYAVRAIIYGSLAFAAARMALGDSSGGSGSSGGQTDSMTARVMEMPAGRWLVGLVGLIIIAYGIHRLVQAWRSDIGKHMRLGEVSHDAGRWIIHVSRFGIAARGVVFAIVGWFFVQAALQYDASEAGGVAEALNSIAGESYGQWLLALVALGLVAFGVYSLLQAKSRRIDVA